MSTRRTLTRPAVRRAVLIGLRVVAYALALGAVAVVGYVDTMMIATGQPVTVVRFSGGGQHGLVVGWYGRVPGPVQCAGVAWGQGGGPFVNVDC